MLHFNFSLVLYCVELRRIQRFILKVLAGEIRRSIHFLHDVRVDLHCLPFEKPKPEHVTFTFLNFFRVDDFFVFVPGHLDSVCLQEARLHPRQRHLASITFLKFSEGKSFHAIVLLFQIYTNGVTAGGFQDGPGK